jgi:hypothetical protein
MAKKRGEETVPIEPFQQWLKATYPTYNANEISRELDVCDRTIRAVLQRERKSVTLTFVDKAFTRLGSPELLNELYPLDEEEVCTTSQ